MCVGVRGWDRRSTYELGKEGGTEILPITALSKPWCAGHSQKHGTFVGKEVPFIKNSRLKTHVLIS